MTNTTTDAAEARALTVIQADRDAAADFMEYYRPAGWKNAGINIRKGAADKSHSVLFFARHRLATAEAASGAGEREELAAFGASEAAGYQYPGADQAAERAAFCAGAAHAASLPPATDPAISGLSSFPPNWKLRQMHFSAPCADDRKWHVNVYGGREGGDTFVGRGTSADEALRDAARNACTALAAAPTIPATGADVRVGETLAERDRRIYAQGRKDACEEYDLDAGKVATIPATGHAATEGEGA